MQKQLGRIGRVRVRSAEKRTHGSKRIRINLPPGPLVPQENRVCVISAAGPAVPEASTTTAEGASINLLSGSLIAQENTACVLSAAGAIAPEASTTPLEKYREYAMTETMKVSTITRLFAAWRSYRARARKKREAIQMLSLSCVLRPVDVELRYTTSLQRLGVCIGTPETQPSHDLTPSVYLQPLTTNMRVWGNQLLQRLRQELTAKYEQHVWKEMEIGKRRWEPFG
jgi:hypothetical protein